LEPGQTGWRILRLTPHSGDDRCPLFSLDVQLADQSRASPISVFLNGYYIEAKQIEHKTAIFRQINREQAPPSSSPTDSWFCLHI
jgi:hypothetical protein